MLEGKFESQIEVSKKKNKEKHVGLVEASILVAALTVLDHNPAHALELASQTSWSNAVTESIKESVRKDTNESRFTYLKYSNNEGEWVQTTSGEGARTEFNVAQYARTLLSNPKYSAVEKICSGHSHPNEVFRSSTPNSDAYKKLAAPPSTLPGDLQTAGVVERELGAFRIPREKLVNFVADTYGIWYFRTAQPSDYRSDDGRNKMNQINTPEAKGKFDKAYLTFIRKSLMPNINLTETQEYKNLLEAYRVNRGGIVRFVPYDKVPLEPPCAGVDFKGLDRF